MLLSSNIFQVPCHQTPPCNLQLFDFSVCQIPDGITFPLHLRGLRDPSQPNNGRRTNRLMTWHVCAQILSDKWDQGGWADGGAIKTSRHLKDHKGCCKGTRGQIIARALIHPFIQNKRKKIYMLENTKDCSSSCYKTMQSFIICPEFMMK